MHRWWRNAPRTPAVAQNLPARRLKVLFVTFYGKEPYCTVSTIRVHGSSFLDEFQSGGLDPDVRSELSSLNSAGEEDDETPEAPKPEPLAGPGGVAEVVGPETALSTLLQSIGPSAERDPADLREELRDPKLAALATALGLGSGPESAELPADGPAHPAVARPAAEPTGTEAEAVARADAGPEAATPTNVSGTAPAADRAGDRRSGGVGPMAVTVPTRASAPAPQALVSALHVPAFAIHRASTGPVVRRCCPELLVAPHCRPASRALAPRRLRVNATATDRGVVGAEQPVLQGGPTGAAALSQSCSSTAGRAPSDVPDTAAPAPTTDSGPSAASGPPALDPPLDPAQAPPAVAAATPDSTAPSPPTPKPWTFFVYNNTCSSTSLLPHPPRACFHRPRRTRDAPRRSLAPMRGVPETLGPEGVTPNLHSLWQWSPARAEAVLRCYGGPSSHRCGGGLVPAECPWLPFVAPELRRDAYVPGNASHGLGMGRAREAVPTLASPAEHPATRAEAATGIPATLSNAGAVLGAGAPDLAQSRGAGVPQPAERRPPHAPQPARRAVATPLRHATGPADHSPAPGPAFPYPLPLAPATRPRSASPHWETPQRQCLFLAPSVAAHLRASDLRLYAFNATHVALLPSWRRPRQAPGRCARVSAAESCPHNATRWPVSPVPPGYHTNVTAQPRAGGAEPANASGAANVSATETAAPAENGAVTVFTSIPGGLGGGKVDVLRNMAQRIKALEQYDRDSTTLIGNMKNKTRNLTKTLKELDQDIAQLKHTFYQVRGCIRRRAHERSAGGASLALCACHGFHCHAARFA